MPNRDIKESCRSSPTLDRLSDFAERFFWRLTTVADDYGRFPADPRFMRSETFPLKDDLKTGQVEKAFNELIKAGLVIAYRDGDRTYAQFVTWEKHQRCRAKHSKYPPPSSDVICRQMTADVADPRSPIPDKDPKDRSTIIRSPRPAAAGASMNGWQYHFNEFWSFWPYRVAKGQAEATFRKLYQSNGLPGMDVLRREVASQQAEGRCLFPNKTRDGRDTRPHASTWLNGKRWEDETPVKATQWEPPEERARKGDKSGLADFFSPDGTSTIPAGRRLKP